ncbi:FkbM family methyltransferase [Sphaerotilus sp.]|uniref:FkbM family methyltransferase n=1 Tax=Sphaerotilus sp. TaxID=2093942 RepID=UPI002ACEA65D|nr:FkbM family methyltransferase [Sphaerotilus sp.]MDZ7855366.1 FkbM family methyltransferase [Sphaerotilus sp.]
MPSNPRMPLWLDLLRTLHPPCGVLLVGAGDGASPWVQRLMQWETRHVTLVEGDETQFRHLHGHVPERHGWQLRQEVVAAEATSVTYHQANLSLESGLLEPESLRSIWPHLATRLTSTRRATTLEALMRECDAPPNWLVVDCLPALALLQGAAERLQGVEVIAARVLLGTDPLTAGPAGQQALQAWLETQGFRYLEAESERHPAIGHALFVRDTPARLRETVERLAEATRHQHQMTAEWVALQMHSADQAETARAEIARLTEAHTAAEALARAQQQHIEQLQHAAAQAAAQAATEATTTQRAHADEIARLTKAQEAADKLAADRHRLITQLRQAAIQADTTATAQARAHADEVARLTEAHTAAEALARAQQQHIEQLQYAATQAAAQATTEATTTQRAHADEIARLTKAQEAADKLAADRHRLITQLRQAAVQADTTATAQARAHADEVARLERASQKAEQEANRPRGDADIDDLIHDISAYFTERSLTYVDVGAYVGDVFLKLAGSRQIKIREAHLYEPNPTSYQTLTTKLESCRLPTLHAYHLAVGAQPALLHFNAAQSMTRVVEPEPGSPQVSNTFTAQSVSLDEQARLFTDQKINLLKIDVEGRELDVLTGATELLQAQRIDMLYIEVGFNCHGTQQSYFADIDRFLQDKGYRVFRVYEQMNEWTEDSPLLRRCNVAYMSERFARANPSKLTRRLRTLQEELDRLKSASTPPLTPALP